MNLNSLKELIEIDSPSGFTHSACQYVFKFLEDLGYQPRYTNKGAVACSIGPDPSLSIAAHVDTLGAIVSQVRSDGHLKISTLGGLSLNMAEGEYCRIRTLKDKTYSGTLLLDNPSVHVNKEVSKSVRSIDNVYVRLDEVVSKKSDTEALGIRVGDIVCFDTRYQELDNGYIKSRYLDNKAGCFVLMELARHYATSDSKPAVELFFSNYEETGHGAASGFANSITDMLVIDMGVVGSNVEGSELACSICAKDSSGPYDYHFRKELVELCEEHNISHRLDIYPYYGSDGSAALRAGNEFRVALIGPGVAASHGVERTHKDGIEATIKLCQTYIDTREK
jgi:putative aminopeptidase FrvX